MRRRSISLYILIVIRFEYFVYVMLEVIDGRFLFVIRFDFDNEELDFVGEVVVVWGVILGGGEVVLLFFFIVEFLVYSVNYLV